MFKRYVLVLFSFLVAFTYSFAANYYWVGGSGNWSDLTHWATTSGGATKHVIAPSSLDDVFFDANSFTGNAQTVNVNIAGVCRNFDWTGAATTYSGNTNGPTFSIASQLEVFGNLKFVSGMRPIGSAYGASIKLSGSTTGKTITTEGFNINGGCVFYLTFNSSGEWSLTDSIVGGLILHFNAGTFNSNNNPIRCSQLRFGTSGSTANIVVNLGTSNIQITGFCDGIPSMGFSNSTYLTLNDANASYTFRPYNWLSPREGSIAGSGGTVINIKGRIKTYLPKLTCIYGTFTFSDLYAYGNTFFYNFTLTDTLYLHKGTTLTAYTSYYSDYLYSFGAGSKLIADGTCEKAVIIRGNRENNNRRPIFTKTGGWGGTTLSYCNIENTQFTASGTVAANNSVDLGGNSGISFTAPTTPSPLYWVGGSGYWHDGSHWSNTSGGAAIGCIPNATTDVRFDANSFSAGGQSVTIDTVSAYCRDIDWTGATNTPTFKTTQPASYDASGSITLNIYGSITFIANMNVQLYQNVYLKTSGTANITSAGKEFNSWEFYFDGTGTYNLIDSMRIMGPRSTGYYHRTTGATFLRRGTLNTNNKTFRLRSFFSSYEETRAINLGASKVYLNLVDGHYQSQGVPWQVNSTNMTFNAGQSTIYVDFISNGSQNALFDGGNLNYNNLVFVKTGDIIPTIQNIGIVDTLISYTSFISKTNMTVSGMLQLTGAKTYTFEAARTITFSGTGILNAIGGCAGIIEIKSSSSTRAIFSKSSGSIGTADNISLQNMEGLGGATYNALNSMDFGGNVGWTIGAGTPRILYWVGGTGNWSESSHWSLSSGGAAGNCPPSRIDSVVFNNASFSAANQIVTIDLDDASCKGMNWDITTNNPQFTGPTNKRLRIYGSIKLDAQMNYNVSCRIYLHGSGTITSDTKAFKNTVYIDAPNGTYRLADAINVNSPTWDDGIRIIQGNFNSNNKTITTNIFTVGSDVNAGTVVDLTSSIINITVYWNLPGFQSWNNSCNTAGNNFTFIPGTSTIYINGPGYFFGGCKTYNRVIFNTQCTYHGLNGNNTFRYIEFKDNAEIHQSNTFIDTVLFASGKTYTFGVGRTQTFGCDTYIDLIGGAGPVITIQSSAGGSQTTFTKPCGRICADYIWLKDNNATGGASWKTGANADNKGGNSGWDFTPYLPVGTAALSGGATVCPASAQTLTFDITGPLPVDLTYSVNDGSTTTSVTIAGVAATPHTVTVNPTVTTTYELTSIFRDDCAGGAGVGSGSAVFTIKSGTAGLWDGSVSTDWFDCANWADGVVPISSTNVSIPNGLARYPIIAAAGAVCNNITIASGGSNPSLTINNSLSTLTVYGNFTLNGSFTHTNGLVTFTGTATNQLGGTADYNFYNLTINNANNVTMSRSITVNNVLNLNAGSLGIGSNTLTLLGTLTGSATLSGSINSILNISGSGALGTLRFAAGARVVGNLNMNRSSSGTVTLGSPLLVNSSVSFTNGIINTSSTNYLEFADNASYSNASDNSHVNGPVRKTGNDAFIFPIGKDGRYQWCAITAPTTVTDAFTAEYFAADGSVVFGSARVASLTFLSKCNYWLVDRNAGSSAISLTLSWNQYSCGSLVGAANLLKVAHWNGTQWIDEGNGGYNVTGTNEGNVVSANSINSFSPFTLGSPSSNNALPIELISFTAKLNYHQQVDLQWITATETNNDYFTVERSADGFAFEGIITTKGAGNSVSVITYDKTDYSPLSGLSYYRLKQNDFDGKYSYSQVVPIEYTESIRDFTLYPNPVIRNGSDNITFQLAGLGKDSSVLLVLRDVLGKEFYSKIILTDNIGNVKLAIESSEPIPAGIYIISATSNNQLISKKVIIE